MPRSGNLRTVFHSGSRVYIPTDSVGGFPFLHTSGDSLFGWHPEVLVCSLVAQSCPTLRDPMDCSAPGLLVLHHLPSLLRPMSIESGMPSNHLVLCHPFSSCPQSFLASWYSPTSRLFASGGRSIGASTSASVLPMNIQSWVPLGLTGLISLLFKILSRVFSTTIQKHQFLGTQLSLWSNSHIHTRLLEKP